MNFTLHVIILSVLLCSFASCGMCVEFALSVAVRLYARNNCRTSDRIITKFDVGEFSRSLTAVTVLVKTGERYRPLVT